MKIQLVITEHGFTITVNEVSAQLTRNEISSVEIKGDIIRILSKTGKPTLQLPFKAIEQNTFLTIEDYVAWMNTHIHSVSETEQISFAELMKLKDKEDFMNALHQNTTVLNAAILSVTQLFTPLLSEVTDEGYTYMGYAAAGADQRQPVWAILRIRRDDNKNVSGWAGGTAQFNNAWSARGTLTYFETIE